ncbi:MAG: class II aldolase/adducin family protein [Candidatus Bipolaricaulota bacterium]|nr:class II aldolase/adducin family protein [Candidatus Bipolaricaulota bacterium]
MLEELREDVYQALMGLPENGLVMGTSGNVSGKKDNHVVIKPSGVAYDELSPSNLVVVDLSGEVIEGDLRPSVDTPAHLHIYNRVADLRGIVHTHSTYATAFAAMGRYIPLYLTEGGDLFGTGIPVSDYVPPGDEAIGEQFYVKAAGDDIKALLMKQHGVFTAGPGPKDALKGAVTVEHIAKVSYIAENGGDPEELPAEEGERLHKKYMNNYGQEE